MQKTQRKIHSQNRVQKHLLPTLSENQRRKCDNWVFNQGRGHRGPVCLANDRQSLRTHPQHRHRRQVQIARNKAPNRGTDT